MAWTQETAQLARQHNDANVFSLGVRMYPADDAVGFAQVFIATPFSGEPRHARRLVMIADYDEQTGDLPPRPLLSPVPVDQHTRRPRSPRRVTLPHHPAGLDSPAGLSCTASPARRRD